MVSEVISKSNIDRLLHEGIINVIFRKKDGSERTMKCTLIESLIVPYARKNDSEGHSTQRLKNEDIAAVWDIDKNEWRSFRYDSVIKIYK